MAANAPVTGFPFLEQIREIGRQARVAALAVALYDYALDFRFSFQASRVFHAASTIKLAILFALFRAAETGRLRLTDRLHVRNRFRSQADGSPFFPQADRDGAPDLYKLIGRTATLQGLAETMIVRSRNLATNLLVDHLEVGFVPACLAAAALDALRCVRGVEDEAAFARGLNNLVTADGPCRVSLGSGRANTARGKAGGRMPTTSSAILSRRIPTRPNGD